MVRIIIAGGRDFDNYELLKKSVYDVIFDLSCRNKFVEDLNNKKQPKDFIEFISGTAKGADKLGEKFVSETIWSVKRFPADWNTYGKSAGYIRNEQMAKYAMSDNCYGVLIAFWDGKSKGTKHMIDLANKHGLEVHVFNY